MTCFTTFQTQRCLDGARPSGARAQTFVQASLPENASASQEHPRALSSEADAGSREENASRQELRASVLVQSEPKLQTVKGGKSMRLLVPFLIALGAIYFWDAHYNNGIVTDGAKSMLGDIARNFR
jgi:hypothetical protein